MSPSPPASHTPPSYDRQRGGGAGGARQHFTRGRVAGSSLPARQPATLSKEGKKSSRYGAAGLVKHRSSFIMQPAAADDAGSSLISHAALPRSMTARRRRILSQSACPPATRSKKGKKKFKTRNCWIPYTPCFFTSRSSSPAAAAAGSPNKSKSLPPALDSNNDAFFL